MADAGESERTAIEVVARRCMAQIIRTARLVPNTHDEGPSVEQMKRVHAEMLRRADQIDVTDEQYSAAYEYLEEVQ